MRSLFYVNVDVIPMMYTLVCMYRSYNDQTLGIKETPGRGSNDKVGVFEVLMSIHPCTVGFNLRCCFEPSQIATVPHCDTWENSDFAIYDFVAICDQSHVVVNCVLSHISRVLCTWDSTPAHICHQYCKLHFFHVGIIWAVYTYEGMYVNYKCHKKNQAKPREKLEWQCQHLLRCAFLSLIREVLFWAPTNCDSHKLRQVRKH